MRGRLVCDGWLTIDSPGGFRSGFSWTHLCQHPRDLFFEGRDAVGGHQVVLVGQVPVAVVRFDVALAVVIGAGNSGLTELKIGDVVVQAALPQTVAPGTTLTLQVKSAGALPQLEDVIANLPR